MRGALSMRRVLRAAALAGVLAGCSGGGGDTGDPPPPPPTPVPTFRCSDSPAAADQVALLCGGKVGADVWRIDAKIGVPTQAADIAGFAFDVLFDPALLAFVPGSEQAGNFFFQAGSPPLITMNTMPGDSGRLVVGIHATGTEGGFQGLPGFEHILSFKMKVVTAAPFDPQLLMFDKARSEALDPSDDPIESISFSDQLLLSLE